MADVPIDSRQFRTVLGHFPTSVVAVTSTNSVDEPVGMIVGSFTSVSLDPPLVSFLADRKSQTFEKIRESGRYCANVLAADQEAVCRQLARPGPERFKGLELATSGLGNPLIAGAVAWVDCSIEDVIQIGDHHLCVGRVRGLDVVSTKTPLLFFRGAFGDYYSPAELVLEMLTRSQW